MGPRTSPRPIVGIDRPNVAQIMAALDVTGGIATGKLGRDVGADEGQRGDRARMALLITGLALFFIVHLVPMRPSARGADRRHGPRHLPRPVLARVDCR